MSIDSNVAKQLEQIVTRLLPHNPCGSRMHTAMDVATIHLDYDVGLDSIEKYLMYRYEKIHDNPMQLVDWCKEQQIYCQPYGLMGKNPTKNI